MGGIISPFVIVKIGESNARELFLTGQRFDASHAQKIGLGTLDYDLIEIDE